MTTRPYQALVNTNLCNIQEIICSQFKFLAHFMQVRKPTERKTSFSATYPNRVAFLYMKKKAINFSYLVLIGFWSASERCSNCKNNQNVKLQNRISTQIDFLNGT